LGIGLGAGYLTIGFTRAGIGARLLPYLLGAVSVAAVLWGTTVLIAGFTPVWSDIVAYPVSLYPRARSIPIGDGHEGPVVLVLGIAFALIWVWGVVRAYHQRSVPAERARLIALVLSGLLVFTWVRTRADGIHALDAWPLTAILLALLMERRGRLVRRARGVFPTLVPIAGILLLSVAAGGTAFRDLALPAAAAGVPRSGFSGERAWMPTPELAGLIREIHAATPDGRPIWIGLQRNDLVLFNDVTLYFLTDRK